MPQKNKWDYCYSIRVTRGSNVSNVTLTQTTEKSQAMAKFKSHCLGLTKDVKAELLDPDGTQIARNW